MLNLVNRLLTRVWYSVYMEQTLTFEQEAERRIADWTRKMNRSLARAAEYKALIDKHTEALRLYRANRE